MYAIQSKFPDQKRFVLIDVKNGEQVGKWMFATLFKTRERAEEVVKAIKHITVKGVEYKVVKYSGK